VVTHPQVLEYRVERTMQCKIDLLIEYGVRPQDIPKLVTRAPNLFALAVEKSLKPRVNYLLEEVGIDRAIIGEVCSAHLVPPASTVLAVSALARKMNAKLFLPTRVIGTASPSR
jgi:hypothetical protein